MISYFIKRTAFYAVLTLIITPFQGKAQTPAIEWEKTYGSGQIEESKVLSRFMQPISTVPTNDGGYIMAVTVNNAKMDIRVIKVDATGTLQWQKDYGGSSGDEYASAIIQTSDGGFAIIGHKVDLNIDDVWVIKTDAAGVVQWQKTYGGSDMDVGVDIRQTMDGGYIVGAHTQSSDGDIGIPNRGYSDYWVFKLNSSGVIEWGNTYGGNSWDVPCTIKQTNDGGYVLTGYTNSNSGDVNGRKGGITDVWVLNLYSDGNIAWKKCYGGSKQDIAYDIIQTTDGGYLVVGNTNSKDGDVSSTKGGADVWALKLKSSGSIDWEKTIGGSGADDGGWTVIQTADGGYLIAGRADSNNGDIDPSERVGGDASWIIKLSSGGVLQWNKIIAGTGGYRGGVLYAVNNTSDGGYILGGVSSNAGFVGNTAWLIKLKGSASGTNDFNEYSNELTIYPNPADDYIEVVSENGALLSGVNIISTDGKKVYPATASGSSAKINISNLASGNYLLKVETKDGTSIIKHFVKP